MVDLLPPLQLLVAPVPGGLSVGLVADSPRLVTGLAVILGVPGKWSSTSCWGAGAAPFVLVAGLLVPGFIWMKPPERCPARLSSPPLIPVPE